MFNLILAAISAFIMMFILSGEGMDREHLELLNTENKINFDQFVRDYLNVGEVNFLNYIVNALIKALGLNFSMGHFRWVHIRYGLLLESGLLLEISFFMFRWVSSCRLILELGF